MTENLFIIGAGIWGSALAIALSNQYKKIFLYTHSKTEFQTLCHNNKHPLLTTKFNNNIQLTTDINVIKKTNAILIAVPSVAFYKVIKQIKPLITQQKIAWVTKGFDNTTQLSKIFKDEYQIDGCIISGPSFALEVSNNKPTALVVASKNETLSQYWAKIFQTPFIRSYQNNDIIGVEVGGLVKNSLAIATGIANGLEFGANTQAAIITRGLNEMINLGVALGAKKNTFMGLSGLGDLTLTCSDNQSRNRQFGQYLAKGFNAQESLKKVGSTVEGLEGVNSIIAIAEKLKIEMPICQQVFNIIKGKTTPKESVNYLMSRNQQQE
ncbi:Glycerol-3-phosphate dehydrogenase [NAD(P)+] [hydrothermal vent metagenome]|uniref:Glycerol-3-phosphate dehydrogenase [NAD(P)+] n=1 Tax=hydrothermal vent metagenome TaxID=652676 RepID=A0A1W1CE66_9ZZZZ